MDIIKKWEKFYHINLEELTLQTINIEIKHKITNQSWVLKLENIELFNNSEEIVDNYITEIHNQVRNSQINKTILFSN